MTAYLLDASVLIALTAAEHIHHQRATAWAAGVETFAVCPIVEGALVRFAVRMGARPEEAQETLRMLRARQGYEFWPDTVSYADSDLTHVRGHRQVTDAYLVCLAINRGAKLATLDEGLAQERPDATLLVPSQ